MESSCSEPSTHGGEGYSQEAPHAAVGSRGLEGYRLGRPRKVFWGRQDWGWVLSNGQDLETLNPPPPTGPQEGEFAGGGSRKAPEEKSAGEFQKGRQ